MSAAMRVGLICVALGLVAGLMIGTSLNCHPTVAVAPVDIAQKKDSTFHTSTTHVLDSSTKTLATYDTTIITKFRHDTIYAKCPPSVISEAPKFPLSYVNMVPLASQVISAFRPQEPRQLIELYASPGYDYLGGRPGGSLELSFNLDKLRIANVSVFVALMIWRGIEVVLGIRGKLWGAW